MKYLLKYLSVLLTLIRSFGSKIDFSVFKAHVHENCITWTLLGMTLAHIFKFDDVEYVHMSTATLFRNGLTTAWNSNEILVL